MSHIFRPAVLAAALAAAGFALPALSQGTAPAKSGASSSVSADDRKFMEDAAMGGMTEVEASKQAQQKATNEQVKQFANQMVTDHTKANDELKGLASSKSVTLPTALDKKHQKEVDELAKESKKFDHEYMEMMVKDHKKTVAEFKKHSTGAKDSDVKAWAAKTLPTLENHLKMAEDTEKAAKSAPAKGK